MFESQILYVNVSPNSLPISLPISIVWEVIIHEAANIQLFEVGVIALNLTPHLLLCLLHHIYRIIYQIWKEYCEMTRDESVDTIFFGRYDFLWQIRFSLAEQYEEKATLWNDDLLPYWRAEKTNHEIIPPSLPVPITTNEDGSR